MRRPTAIAALGAAGLAALAACLVSGIAYSSARRSDDAITDRALAALRREARAPRAKASRQQATARVCPEDAEGLAVASRRALGIPLLARSGAIDAAAIAAISNAAIAAARYLERARAAPALPQRLGRELAADGSWVAIEPAPTGCATIPRPLSTQRKEPRVR